VLIYSKEFGTWSKGPLPRYQTSHAFLCFSQFFLMHDLRLDEWLIIKCVSDLIFNYRANF
jgi:hypothetical protein